MIAILRSLLLDGGQTAVDVPKGRQRVLLAALLLQPGNPVAADVVADVLPAPEMDSPRGRPGPEQPILYRTSQALVWFPDQSLTHAAASRRLSASENPPDGHSRDRAADCGGRAAHQRKHRRVSDSV
jgi:hypothetical protein